MARSIIALVVVLGVLSAARPYRNYVDALLTNRIGAPTATAPLSAVLGVGELRLHLAVAGDVGTGEAPEYATAAAMDLLEADVPYDALLLLGDNVYDNGDPTRVEIAVTRPFAGVLDQPTALYSVLGNHDVQDGHGPAQVAALNMAGRWYSTNLGNVDLIALDSNEPDNADQLAWLEATLSASETPWIIVILHHPAYSAGWHGSEPGVQEHFVPLFEKYGVDLVLAGHDHDYQRSNVINGVTYVVTGAAAKTRDAGQEDFTAVSWSTYSFVDLAVYDNRIEGQAVNQQGRAIDSFKVTANP